MVKARYFSGNSLSGTVSVTQGRILFNQRIEPIDFEGNVDFNVAFRKGSFNSRPLYISDTITLIDTAELTGITANTLAINEGDFVTFTVATSGVESSNIKLYYSTLGNVVYNDFVGGNIGSFYLVNGSGTIPLQLNADLSTNIESDEQFQLQIRKDSTTGTVLGTSANVVIVKDTSNSVGVTSTTISSNLLYETESTIITIDTVNALGNAGGTLYYTITGNADIYTGQSGSIVVNDNTANLELVADASVLPGQTRQFAVEFRKGSTSGEVLYTTDTIRVNHFGGEIAADIDYGGAVSITYDEENDYLTAVYTSTGPITVNSLSPTPSFNSIDYLVVGGGGGGGAGNGGGGGAGGLLTGSLELTSPAIGPSTVTIGGGGAGSAQNPQSRGFNGNGSTLFGISTDGGGGGGGSGTPGAARPGASGGGGSVVSYAAGASGTPGQGFPGGNGTPTSGGNGGGTGGGGGAGGAGSSTGSTSVGGPGGVGLAIPWMPASYGTDNTNNNVPTTLPRYFAGGGGGGGYPGGASPGQGGAGGGGNGGRPDAPGSVKGPIVSTGGGGAGQQMGNRASPAGAGGIIGIRQKYSNAWVAYANVVSKISFVTGVTAAANTYFGDQTVTLQVTAANVVSNETLYYSVNNASNSQVVGGNTGSFIITSNNYVEVPVTLNISGTSNITMQVRRNSGTGALLGESENVAIAERPISGGTIVETDTEIIHVFTTSGTLTTASSLSAPIVANVMLVGGGGSGGPAGQSRMAGGGGGAGGVRFANVELFAGNTFALVVGAGLRKFYHTVANLVYDGTGLTHVSGDLTSFDAPAGYIKGQSDVVANVNIRVFGGGRGGGFIAAPSAGGGYLNSTEGAGGGGGGGGYNPPSQYNVGRNGGKLSYSEPTPPTSYGRADAALYEDLVPFANYGFNSYTYNAPNPYAGGQPGGNAYQTPSGNGGGGGGYLTGGGVGSPTLGGVGGDGIGVAGLPAAYGGPGPDPSLRYFGGGGAGGSESPIALSNGGLGGGGNGGWKNDRTGSNGGVNTGGGGGGGGRTTTLTGTETGGAGGSGIIIVRYPK